MELVITINHNSNVIKIGDRPELPCKDPAETALILGITLSHPVIQAGLANDHQVTITQINEDSVSSEYY